MQRSAASLAAAASIRKIAGRTLSAALALVCLTSSLFLLSSQLFQLFLLDEAGYGESYILYDILHFQNTGVIYPDLSFPSAILTSTTF